MSEATGTGVGIYGDFREMINLSRLGGLIARPFFATLSNRHQITLTEWRSLVLIVREPGVSAQEIAESTGLHPVNVSRAVTSLRKQERVTSEKDPENHRRQLLYPTSTGTELFEEMFPMAEERAHELLSALEPEERELFSSMLDKLIERAQVVFVDVDEAGNASDNA